MLNDLFMLITSSCCGKKRTEEKFHHTRTLAEHKRCILAKKKRHSDIVHYHSSTCQKLQHNFWQTTHTCSLDMRSKDKNKIWMKLKQVKVQFSPDEGEHFFVTLHLMYVPPLPYSACHHVHQAAYFSFSLPSSPCSGYAHHLWPSFCFSFSFYLV